MKKFLIGVLLLFAGDSFAEQKDNGWFGGFKDYFFNLFSETRQTAESTYEKNRPLYEAQLRKQRAAEESAMAKKIKETEEDSFVKIDLKNETNAQKVQEKQAIESDILKALAATLQKLAVMASEGKVKDGERVRLDQIIYSLIDNHKKGFGQTFIPKTHETMLAWLQYVETHPAHYQEFKDYVLALDLYLNSDEGKEAFIDLNEGDEKELHALEHSVKSDAQLMTHFPPAPDIPVKGLEVLLRRTEALLEKLHQQKLILPNEYEDSKSLLESFFISVDVEKEFIDEMNMLLVSFYSEIMQVMSNANPVHRKVEKQKDRSKF